MPEKTLTEVFTDIADAIREKTGGAEPIPALDMATAISEIPTGGSDGLDELMLETF